MADTLVVSPTEIVTTPEPPRPLSAGLRRTFTVLVCVVVALLRCSWSSWSAARPAAAPSR